jgi:hypothetical protein
MKYTDNITRVLIRRKCSICHGEGCYYCWENGYEDEFITIPELKNLLNNEL